MTPANDLKVGEPIEWVDLTAGGERQRRGEVWALAPALPGIGRAYWVSPTDGGNGVVLVAVVSTRHRAGTGTTHYRRRTGRWMDKGETYREPESDQAIVNEHRVARQLTIWAKIPALLAPQPQALVDTEAFYAICERAVRGE